MMLCYVNVNLNENIYVKPKVIWYEITLNNNNDQPGAAEEDVWGATGAPVSDTHNRQVCVI